MSSASASLGAVKEEKGLGLTTHEQEAKKVGIRDDLHDQNMIKPSSSNNEGSINSNKEEEEVLESAKAEMGKVKQENENLKKMLERMEKDYQSLQFRFFNIFQQQNTHQTPPNYNKLSTQLHPSSAIQSHDHQQAEPDQLVSLCLGRNPCEPKMDDKSSSITSSTIKSEELKANLTLGLDSKFLMDYSDDQPAGSNRSDSSDKDQAKEEEASKVGSKRTGDVEEVAQQESSPKRARVCVRARCDTPTMNDGCQWRKYGQKISKGNPCPRAYYRCTVATACPVRKQVQRCVDDMSILITTYEGTHNHPLPVSATAMASTTSAAASMILSGSSTSTAGASELNGLDFSLYDTFRKKQQFYLPTNPTATSSSSPLFPTITLDLTTNPSTSSSPFNKFFSSSTSSRPTFPSTSLNFSSSSESTTTFPSIWGNGYPSYASMLPNYNNIGQSQQLLYDHPNSSAYLAKSHVAASQVALTETLTKAITSDPSFRTVLATAISSMINNGSNNHKNNQRAEVNSSLPFSVFNSAVSASNSPANNTEQKS